MRTAIALSLIVMALLSAPSAIAQGEVYLHHISNQFDDSTLLAGRTITFYFAMRNNAAANVTEFRNGFRIFSPVGWTWEPLTYWFSDTMSVLFDGSLTATRLSNDGMGADTIKFRGTRVQGPGLPPGFDAVAFAITTTFAWPGEWQSSVACLEALLPGSSGSYWSWYYTGSQVIPTWSGNHCYWLWGLVNYPPGITNCPSQLSIPYGGTYTYDFNAYDPDSDPVTFSLTSGRGSINQSTGLWTFTPSEGDIGQSFNLTVCASDWFNPCVTRCTVQVEVTDPTGTQASGFVYDKYTSSAMSNVTVTLWQAGQQVGSAVTGPSGKYDFGRVLKGDYVVKINHPGYFVFEKPVSFTTDISELDDIHLFDNTNYITSEPLLTAFEAFRSAFRDYFSSECTQVQSALDLQIRRLGEPDFSVGRALAKEVLDCFPNPTATFLQEVANKRGVFTKIDHTSVGSMLLWTGLNTGLQYVKSELLGFLNDIQPPGASVYSTKAIIMPEMTPTTYSMTELLTLLDNPLGPELPDYVVRDFPMTQIISALESGAARLAQYAAAPPEPLLPRDNLYLGLPGNCNVDALLVLPLADLAHTGRQLHDQFAQVLAREKRERLVSNMCGVYSGSWALAGVTTELTHNLSYFAWVTRMGCQQGVFLSDIIDAAAAADLGINYLNFNGYWPMKLAQYYRMYDAYKNAFVYAVDNRNALNCSPSVMFVPPQTPGGCVPSGQDYVVATGQYPMLNNSPDKDATIRIEGKVVRVRTVYGMQYRADVGTFSTGVVTVPAGQSANIPYQYPLPNTNMFTVPTYYEIVPTLITSAGIAPGMVTTAHSVPEAVCQTQEWFEETTQTVEEAIQEGEEIIDDIAVGAESVWQRVRMRFGGSDVDLHLYDDLGGHLGRNHSTGAIENTLGNAVLMGDSTTEETIDFYPQAGRTYSYKMVGVDLPDSEQVSLSVISFRTIAPQPILSPTSIAGFGQIRDTVSASIHLYDLCGRNTITISDFTVSDLIGPGPDTIHTSALTIIHPDQVLPDSSAVLAVSFLADTTLQTGTYFGSAQLTTDAGNRSIPISFQVSPASICGDANGDRIINIGDAVYLVNYLFRGGFAPLPRDAGDANCDHTIAIGDAVYLVSYIFRGGPAPCCP